MFRTRQRGNAGLIQGRFAMRDRLCRLAVLAAGLAVAAVWLPGVRAQQSGQTYLGPYSVYNADLTRLRPGFGSVPTSTRLSLSTTVTVPDGGTVTLGGYSRLSEGRNEFGPPVLGKLPYAGRAFRNVGYGRSVQSTRVTVGARIIILEEEEYRQTGVRSGP
jgi:hypothetical protein